MNYLLFRLFAKPILTIVGSVYLYVVMAYWLPQKFSTSPFLNPLGSAIQEHSAFIPLVLTLFGTTWCVFNGFRLWQWSQGEEPCCPNCGMMMEEKVGRYGAYLRCMRPSCRGKLDF